MASDTMMADPVVEAQGGMVTVPIEQHAVLLHGAAFAKLLIATARNTVSLSSSEILAAAERYGLHYKRAFSEEELSDPEQMLAVLGLDPDDRVVDEMSPALLAALEGFEIEEFSDNDDDEGDEAVEPASEEAAS